MKVKLRLFATYREFLPEGVDGNTIEVEVKDVVSVGDLVAQYGVPTGRESVILLNGTSTSIDELLIEGDVVSAFPALAGG